MEVIAPVQITRFLMPSWVGWLPGVVFVLEGEEPGEVDDSGTPYEYFGSEWFGRI